MIRMVVGCMFVCAVVVLAHGVGLALGVSDDVMMTPDLDDCQAIGVMVAGLLLWRCDRRIARERR